MHTRKMAFCILLLALLSGAAFSSYGYSRIKLVRSWVVENASGMQIDLSGALSANSSSQKIISISTEPEMEQTLRDGVVWVAYHGISGSDRMVFNATAIADIDYDPHILSDGPSPGAARNATNLTEADSGIRQQAQALSDPSSSLETIRSLAEWVHGNVVYDISYWGRSNSAITTFKERRGVCVEYTHLLIAMARSLGFDTRYVSGYIYVNGWQQHAWAEIAVPGYGWLPADATFGQVGVLDDTHFAIHYADDQSQTYDTLTSSSDAVGLDAYDAPSVVLQNADAKGISMDMVLDNKTYLADVTINNTRQEYSFGSYSFLIPASYGSDSFAIVLLKPGQARHFYHGINESVFQEGYSYSIPLRVSFNDLTLERDMVVSGSAPALDGNQSGQGAGTPQASSGCQAAAALILLTVLVALAKHELPEPN